MCNSFSHFFHNLFLAAEIPVITAFERDPPKYQQYFFFINCEILPICERVLYLYIYFIISIYKRPAFDLKAGLIDHTILKILVSVLVIGNFFACTVVRSLFRSCSTSSCKTAVLIKTKSCHKTISINKVSPCLS